MKKNTKKKVFTLMLVILLLSIAIVGGSLAWFTAESKVVENTFTVGSIKIEQIEDFDKEHAQHFMPIVNTANPSADENYVKKEVKIQNTGGNPAYVRTHIAIPQAFFGNLHLDTKEQNWNYVGLGSVTVDDIPYCVFSYQYNFPLQSNETSDLLLRGVYLDAKIDVQKNTGGTLAFCYKKNPTDEFTFIDFDMSKPIKVLVATQAVQEQGFASAEAAFKQAFDNTLPSFANP